MLPKFGFFLLYSVACWLAGLPFTVLSLWLMFRGEYPSYRYKIMGHSKRHSVFVGFHWKPKICLLYEPKLFLVYWLWFCIDISDWGQEEDNRLMETPIVGDSSDRNWIRYRTFQLCTAFIAQHTCRDQNRCNWCEHARRLRKDLEKSAGATVG